MSDRWTKLEVVTVANLLKKLQRQPNDKEGFRVLFEWVKTDKITAKQHCMIMDFFLDDTELHEDIREYLE
tara:strand:- start:1573 stop:1782 length:210 start_codon:yes stop_codon:yes gene_type:complete